MPLLIEPPGELFFSAAKYVLAALVGALIAKRVEGKAELVTNWGHMSSFTTRGDKPVVLNTHEIVVRNTGKKAANNVRITHRVLPADFNLFPSVPYAVEELPDRSKDIVIRTMSPGEQLTISYLYQPPLTAAQINSAIRSDEGFAKAIEMELSEKTSRSAIAVAVILMLIGSATVLYWVWRGLSRFGWW